MRRVNIRNALFAFLLFLVFFALVLRSSGIYPVVADEWVHSQSSRLSPLAMASIPGYFYLYIYKLTSLCGDGFLNCARIINCLFFVSSAPFIYAITREVASRLIAILVAFLAMVGPINSYTVYFMPEAFYFMAFWIISWYVLHINQCSLKNWLCTGALIGLASLIKPHALFLVPAIVLYMTYISRGRLSVVLWSKSISVFLLALFITKLFIGYLFAGKAGITIFGASYGAAAASTAANMERYLTLVGLTFKNLSGHIIVICTLFSLPLAFAFYRSLVSIFSRAEPSQQERVCVYMFFVLGILILIVGLFTASIANTGPYESIDRLHMRYYSFCLPVFLIIVSSMISEKGAHQGKKLLSICVALPILGAIFYSLVTKLKIYQSYYVDAPDLAGFMANQVFFIIFCSLSFVSVVLWLYREHLGAKFYLFIYAPLMLITSSYYINDVLSQNRFPDEYDRAAMVTKNILNQEQLSKLHMVGSNPGLMNLTLFQLDNRSITYAYIPVDSIYDIGEPARDRCWILIIGNHSLVGNSNRFKFNGFTLLDRCDKSK